MKTPRSVFLDLVRRACLQKLAAYSDCQRYQAALSHGAAIPDSVLPGRLVQGLPEKDREILQGLTAKDTLDRQGA